MKKVNCYFVELGIDPHLYDNQEHFGSLPCSRNNFQCCCIDNLKNSFFGQNFVIFEFGRLGGIAHFWILFHN
jgi:hypothetical protein